ncbi:MAG: phosphatase PAP2 family protein [Candidatus Staskawiczbacteria bacterium]|nr:phosphatase PAP2 family protein [Candidatus Staskawiczbacteria bacterium]
MNIDLYIFNSINSLAFKWYWLDFTGFVIARYSEYILIVVLILFLAVNFERYWRMILEVIIAAILTRFVFVKIINELWFKSRPFVSNNVNLLVDYNAKEASFPSGHASFYFALSTIVYSYNKKIGIIFYIVSLMIVLDRIFVGIHWPSDILAGAVVGVLVGLVLNIIFKKYLPKK